MARDDRPRGGAAKRLHAAIGGLAEHLIVIETSREDRWASITFEGARHTLGLRFDGADAIAAGERFIAALPEHEFDLYRQFVAEATILSVDHALLPEPRLTVTCELLVLDEA